MTFHIASALKFAAVTAGTVLWIGTSAAAPLPPVPDRFRRASSLTPDQAPPENGLTGLPRDIRDARRIDELGLSGEVLLPGFIRSRSAQVLWFSAGLSPVPAL